MNALANYGSGATLILVITATISLVGLLALPALIRVSAFRPYWLIRQSEYWRLVSSGFVHSSLSHLAFNLLTYSFFAFAVERRVGAFEFVVLYFFGLLIGNLGTFLQHRHEPNYSTVGASGAILAVLFASIVYFPSSRMLILPLPVPIPAPLFAILYLGYSYYQSRQGGGSVNHDAHVSGALAGLIFVAVTDPSAYVHLIQILT